MQFHKYTPNRTIDRRILAAVLLELGGATWSAAQINILLCTFKESCHNRICCEEFVDWVFSSDGSAAAAYAASSLGVAAAAAAAAPRVADATAEPSARPTAAGSAALDAYTADLVNNIRQFGNTVDLETLAHRAAACSSPAELRALEDEVLMRWAAHVQEAQSKGLAAVWREFDGDNDGMLTLEECTHLIRAYLQHSAGVAGDLVQASYELGEDVRQAARGVVAASGPSRSAAVKARLAPSVRQVLEEAGHRDLCAAAAELLQAAGPLPPPPPPPDAWERGLAAGLRRVLAPPCSAAAAAPA